MSAAQNWVSVDAAKPIENQPIVVRTLDGKEVGAVLRNGVYRVESGGYLYLHDVKHYKPA